MATNADEPVINQECPNFSLENFVEVHYGCSKCDKCICHKDDCNFPLIDKRWEQSKKDFAQFYSWFMFLYLTEKFRPMLEADLPPGSRLFADLFKTDLAERKIFGGRVLSIDELRFMIDVHKFYEHNSQISGYNENMEYPPFVKKDLEDFEVECVSLI